MDKTNKPREKQNQIQLVFVGDGAVGKTCVLIR
jgi:GTPase SAR1 family protein